MTSDLAGELVALGVCLVLAFFVRRRYRDRRSPAGGRYATFAARFWSAPVDACVVWPVSFVATLLLSAGADGIPAVLLLAAASFAWLIYTVVMHARCGQTVGKMATGVRVVDSTSEGRISWRQAWLREGVPTLVAIGWVAWQAWSVLTGQVSPSEMDTGRGVLDTPTSLIGALPCAWFATELVTMLTNGKRRALHDFIAGTIVVRTP